MPFGLQVEDQKLKNYEGDYAEYLRKNKEEAAIMQKKEEDQRERDKSQIKSKSKVCHAPPFRLHGVVHGICQGHTLVSRAAFQCMA